MYDLQVLKYTRITVDCDTITDWESYFDAFAAAFGFPEFFGRNMDAWIDCMSTLDDPGSGLACIQVPTDGCVVLQLDNAKSFAMRCPDQFAATVECSAFVNCRRLEAGESPLLMLSFGF